MHLAKILLTVVGVGSVFGVGQSTLTSPVQTTNSSVEACAAFCHKCDECYANDEVAKATCRFLMDARQDSCEADCARGVTPSAVKRGGLGEDWSKLTCEQLTATL